MRNRITDILLLCFIGKKNNINFGKIHFQQVIFSGKYLYALLFILFSTGTAIAQAHKFDSIASVVDSISISQGKKSLDLINELYNIAAMSPDSSSLFIKCLYLESNLYYEQGRTDSTLLQRMDFYKDNTSICIDVHEKALLSYSMGMQHFVSGSYADAFTVTIGALNEFKSLGDSIFIAKALKLLGSICSEIELFRMAENYCTEALGYISSENSDYYSIRRNKYRVYMLEDNNKRAVDSLKVLAAVLEGKKYPDMLITTYINLGAAYLTDDPNKAYHYLLKTRELVKDIDNPKMDAIIYQNTAIYYIKQEHDYKTGLSYFYLAEDILKSNGDIHSLCKLYDNISETFEMMGDSSGALYYLKLNNKFADKIRSNLKAVESYQKYIITSLEASENKLIITEQQLELKNKQGVVIIITFVSIILFISLLLLFVQQKRKRKEDENRELAIRLEHEQTIQHIEKEKQEQIIDAKTREITSYSILLSNKNSILQKILDMHAHLYNDRQDIKNDLNKIDSIIYNSFNMDEEWENFKIHFEQVHPTFFDKLRSAYPTLTEDNLKFCAYFKLGLSIKQIARILNILPQSVLNHRYRLKKKLGFSEDDDLDTFIHNL